MSIDLIVAAVQLPVLLSEVRDFLKISHQDEDPLISTYIRAAATACENFTGRKLISQQWQMTLNDWGYGEIQIPLTPVMTVDKVEYFSGGIFKEISVVSYVLDRTSYQAKIIPVAGIQWPDPEKDIAGIKITLTAGFGEDQNKIPHDIRLGLLHWVSAAYDGGKVAENQAYYMAQRLWQPYRRVML